MEGTIARSYKYRLYPTAEQAALLATWQEVCFDVQKWCISDRRQYKRYRDHCLATNRTPATAPTWASQGRAITALRQQYDAVGMVPSDLTSAIVQRVDRAYQSAYQTTKKTKQWVKVRWAERASAIGLTFRGAMRGTQLVSVNGRWGYWKLSAGSALGLLKVRMHRPLPDGAVIKQAHITQRADGWYLSLSCVILQPKPLAPAKYPITGVDIGCIHKGDSQRIAITDDGRVYRSTDHLKRNAKRLAALQKLASPTRKTHANAKKADPASKRSARRRERIARMHQRIARQREHVQQYVARRLVDTAETVVFENLNHQGMRRKGKGRRKSGLNRSLSTAAPGRLIALVTEKAEAAQRVVVQVDARYTSQECCLCGERGEKKGLQVREWTCANCQTTHDRDVNAAANIAKRGGKDVTLTYSPLFKRGVRGEGVAANGRKQRSMNREAPSGASAEIVRQGIQTKKQTDRSQWNVVFGIAARNSTAQSCKKRVAKKSVSHTVILAHQEALF